ncbi:hypothetical protein [Sphingobium sp. CR2-8]|uniref:hypothetical protein n=1 Tax=Sphingobium sp. CR2-8 TaxID=1306534 RepID=UPI003FA3A87B
MRVVYRGVPVVSALWCSTSHLLTPGVYHDGSGAGLRFEGEQVSRMPNPAVRKRRAIRIASLARVRGMGARQEQPRSNVRSWRQAFCKSPGSRHLTSGMSLGE